MGGTGFLLFGLLLLMVAWSAGLLRSSESDQVAPIDRTGQLAFPALSRPVPAFEKLTREDFLNPRTGQINVAWLSESNASVVSRDFSTLINRVVRRDKAAGMVITEADLMPVGTRAGMAAGIPAGKVAISVPAESVAGLALVRRGDRFDLLAHRGNSDATDAEPMKRRSEPAELFGGMKDPSLSVAGNFGGDVRRLADDAVLVSIESVTRPQTGSDDPKGRPTVPPNRSKSKDADLIEIAELAVAPEDVAAISQAISRGVPLTCVLRSGRPDDADALREPMRGMVPVLTPAQDVEAFSALTDTNLIDEASGQLYTYYFPSDRVGETWLTDASELYGRVLARSVRRGTPLTEADLLPAGTRPGISAGVPEGMVAMVLRTERLEGFGDLSQGDRFAIMAQNPNEVVPNLVDRHWIQMHGGRLDEVTDRNERMLSTGIREVVGDAIYLRSSQDGRATIAVPESKISAVAQLLRDDAELFVAAKSEAFGRKASSSIPASRRNDASMRDDSASFESLPPPTLSRTPMHHLVNQRASDAAVGEANVDDAAFRTGTTRVPVLTRDVDRFSELDFTDFIDPSTGDIRYVMFDDAAIQDDWVIDLGDLVDRVANRAVKAGRVVRSDDLAAPGTRPGPSAGLVPGQTGIIVDSSQIEDLDLLSPGDSIDLLSAGPIDASGLGDRVRRTVSSSDAIEEFSKSPTLPVPIAVRVASGVEVLAELNPIERTTRRVVRPAAPREVVSRVVDGTVVTQTVMNDAIIEPETQTLRRFAIAVSHDQATAVQAHLDRNRPLRVSIRSDRDMPSEGDSSGENDFGPKAYLREHVVDNALPTTEVFLSDRRYDPSW